MNISLEFICHPGHKHTYFKCIDFGLVFSITKDREIIGERECLFNLNIFYFHFHLGGLSPWFRPRVLEIFNKKILPRFFSYSE